MNWRATPWADFENKFAFKSFGTFRFVYLYKTKELKIRCNSVVVHTEQAEDFEEARKKVNRFADDIREGHFPHSSNEREFAEECALS